MTSATADKDFGSYHKHKQTNELNTEKAVVYFSSKLAT